MENEISFVNFSLEIWPYLDVYKNNIVLKLRDRFIGHEFSDLNIDPTRKK
jgi:hypothetical protein